MELLLEPRNLLEPWNLYILDVEPLLATLAPSRPLLGTRDLTWNVLDPLLETLAQNLGTLAQNLRTFRNLYLEPILGTTEPKCQKQKINFPRIKK